MWRLPCQHSHELSLLELHLLTGVKHQLRVHLAQCLNGAHAFEGSLFTVLMIHPQRQFWEI